MYTHPYTHVFPYISIHTSKSSWGLLTVKANGLSSAAIYLPSWADTLVHNRARAHTHADHCAESIQMLPREQGRIRRGRSEDKREVTLSSRGPNEEKSRTPHAREADVEGDTAALPELPFQCPHSVFPPVPTAAQDKPHPLPSRHFLSADRFQFPPQTQFTQNHRHHHLTPWSACLQPKQTRRCPDFKFLLLRPTRPVPALSSSTPERLASNPDTTPGTSLLGEEVKLQPSSLNTHQNLG